MGCIFVIAGGAIGNKDFLRSQIDKFGPDELVCADGGARHVVALDMTPQVIIGDMDSLPPEILQRCEERGSRIIRHPRAKQETDTQLALAYACRSRPDEIRIYGALGGRIDHALANISLLVPAARSGVTTKLVDEWCEVFVIAQTTLLAGIAGQTISLFPLSDMVKGIDLEGFEYPLSGGTMEIGAPYGISNRLQGDRGVIAIGSGCLLVVKYAQPGIFPPGD
ncbi:MAG: thiamine diphosphokinase [Deltaproteobacteria bacterium]|nr:thiamine diphosphokinase [Deltaproteobacteria bacterium]